ncbi:MAG TPA: hypothetical protein VK461_07580 [Acidimicrobiales bacterium]|nr:hypothetical protein [Acidimicrobiales bacterium]
MKRSRSAGISPLSPQQKWKAITIGTLVLLPAFWGMLIGLVSVASDDPKGVTNPAAFIAFGLALVPFAFLVLAFVSGHPNAPMATVKAMGLFLLIGIPVSAIAADAVTGLVAGAGAGGVVALRMGEVGTWKTRALGVAFACAYTLVLARAAGAIVLISVPAFPFTSIGLADHLAERRQERKLTEASSKG